MTIWVVGVSDCESNRIEAICSTKEIAERELFKARDELIKEWQKMIEWEKKEGRVDDMYQKMIANISTNDYKNWDNYPQDCPYLYKSELMEK